MPWLIIRHKETHEIPSVAVDDERWRDLRKNVYKDYEVLSYQDGSKYSGPGRVRMTEDPDDDESVVLPPPIAAADNPEPGLTMRDAARLRDKEQAALEGGVAEDAKSFPTAAGSASDAKREADREAKEDQDEAGTQRRASKT